MKLEKSQSEENGDYDYSFFCPGCNCKHGFWVKGNVTWQFNGNMDKPTVSPSILHKVPQFNNTMHICHSFIKNGMIQYLGDCTHKLANQTIELPEILKITI
jgi:hypothetical protein